MILSNKIKYCNKNNFKKLVINFKIIHIINKRILKQKKLTKFLNKTQNKIKKTQNKTQNKIKNKIKNKIQNKIIKKQNKIKIIKIPFFHKMIILLISILKMIIH